MSDNTFLLDYLSLTRTIKQMTKISELTTQISEKLGQITLSAEVWQSMTDSLFSSLEILLSAPILAQRFLNTTPKVISFILLTKSVCKTYESIDSELAAHADSIEDYIYDVILYNKKLSEATLETEGDNDSMSEEFFNDYAEEDEDSHLGFDFDDINPVYTPFWAYTPDEEGAVIEYKYGADNIELSKIYESYLNGDRLEINQPGKIDATQILIRKYHPDYGDKEILGLLKNLADDQGYYSALTNNILIAYSDDTRNYEKTFGFAASRYALCDEDYDLNFLELMLDFYCATEEQAFTLDQDIMSSTANTDVADHNKIAVPELKSVDEQLSKYATLRGFNAETRALYGVPTSLANYRKYQKQGQVNILVRNATLRCDDNGEFTKIEQPTYMAVTGEDHEYLTVALNGRMYYYMPESDREAIFHVVNIQPSE